MSENAFRLFSLLDKMVLSTTITYCRRQLLIVSDNSILSKNFSILFHRILISSPKSKSTTKKPLFSHECRKYAVLFPTYGTYRYSTVQYCEYWVTESTYATPLSTNLKYFVLVDRLRPIKKGGKGWRLRGKGGSRALVGFLPGAPGTRTTRRLIQPKTHHFVTHGFRHVERESRKSR